MAVAGGYLNGLTHADGQRVLAPFRLASLVAPGVALSERLAAHLRRRTDVRLMLRFLHAQKPTTSLNLGFVLVASSCGNLNNTSIDNATEPTMQSDLLKQIAALPNTIVQPYRDGGGVMIIETMPNGVRQTGVWLDRRSTVERLQDYLTARTA